MKKSTFFITFAILLGLVNLGLIYFTSKPSFSEAKESKIENRDNKSTVKGLVVFQTYCVLCHGENADGKGRLAVGKIPPPADLNKTILNDDQLREIIRGGGESVGRSGFMPPWGEELSERQIDDLVDFINGLKNK